MSVDSTASEVILYGHPACPGVGPVKSILKGSDIEFQYVNIWQDTEAAAQVKTINNGYESVPTLVFSDGSTLTEPSMWELKAKLEALGYKISLLGWVTGNIRRIVLFGFMLYGLLWFFDVI